MNSLFGVELPPSVTFIIAFVIVLALIGATFWLVRRFGAGRLAAGHGHDGSRYDRSAGWQTAGDGERDEPTF